MKIKKLKQCKYCGMGFIPTHNTAQKVCSYQCALKLNRNAVKTKADKAFNKETRKRKDKIKSRSQWLKEAQAAFNAFIRERDKDLPCISCQRFHSGQYHAGHYKSVGSNPELRFDENNNHKQCAPCNNHLSGNIANYRPNLILKIGLEAVESLEGRHDLLKLTIDEIKDIKQLYKNKLKEIKIT